MKHDAGLGGSLLLKYRWLKNKLLPLGTKRRIIYQWFIKHIKNLIGIVPDRVEATSLPLSKDRNMEENNRQEKLFEMIKFAEEQGLYGITREELMTRTLKDREFRGSTTTWIKKESPDRKTFRELVKVRAGRTVLDLGCGVGNFGRILEGKKVTGIDIKPERLEQAKQQNVETICADIRDLRFLKGQRFESALANQVFEHLALNDVVKVLKQLPEYIENNILISVPSISSMPYTAYYDLEPDQICLSEHLTFWTPRLMFNLLSSVFQGAEIRMEEYAKYALFIEGKNLYYHLWAGIILKR